MEVDLCKCYKCGLRANSFCKCRLSCMKCENNHQWVECPTHPGSIIINPHIVSKVHNEGFVCENYCKLIDSFSVYSEHK